MNCNTTHYRANSSSVPGDPTALLVQKSDGTTLIQADVNGVVLALANGSVHNAALASDVARANLLTNGGFEIWQRGNGPLSGTFGPDRWQLWPGGGTQSASRDSANADASGACCALTVGGAVSIGNPAQVYQSPISLTDGDVGLRGKTVSVSVRVKCSVATAFRISLQPSGGTPVASGYHSGSGAYETLTCPAAVIPVGATTTVVTLSTLAEKPGTYYIDNAMLVVGSQPSDYAPLHPADDLARCLRYYELMSSSAGDINVTGYGATGISCQTPLPYKARKAVNPTVTRNGTWTVLNCGQPGAGAAGVDILSIAATVSSTGTYSFTNNGAGMNFSLESNP